MDSESSSSKDLNEMNANISDDDIVYPDHPHSMTSSSSSDETESEESDGQDNSGEI